MASLCTRCALRLRRVAAATDPSTLPRSFSTSSFARRTHAIPQFADTSNAELDNVLASMRDKHFIPAALTKAQRHLIFGDSKREELTKYPQIIEIAGEKIELKWIDRRTEIPNRTRLFQRVLKLMAEDGSPEAWRNLMPLLVGLRRSRVEVSAMEMERLLRLATKSGNFHEVIVCLRRGDETGMTLQRPEVFEGVLLALRSIGQADGWSQESLERALKASRDVAQLLEMDTHGGGIQMKPDDRRKDPRVIGAYLELSAVFAERYQNGKDLDGRVRAYADRLLYNISHAEKMLIAEPTDGPQKDFVLGVAVYHGLKIAQQILAGDMPHAALAEERTSKYKHVLKSFAEKLQQRTPDKTPGGYADQALKAWEECQ